jgi:hypothetical protein
MIHVLFPRLTENASGSRPCRIVSVIYDRPQFFHGDGSRKGSVPVTDYRCELSFLCRENGTESESVDELVEEGNPFEGDVACGGEHADNNEKKRGGHT